MLDPPQNSAGDTIKKTEKGAERINESGGAEVAIMENFQARGPAIKVETKGSGKILGAHIIGPHASILIHELIGLMYAPEQNAEPIRKGMRIHPALSEVVAMAFGSLMRPFQYHDLLEHLREKHRQSLP